MRQQLCFPCFFWRRWGKPFPWTWGPVCTSRGDRTFFPFIMSPSEEEACMLSITCIIFQRLFALTSLGEDLCFTDLCFTLCLIFHREVTKTCVDEALSPLPVMMTSPPLSLGQGNTVYKTSTLKFSVKPANQSIISRLRPLHSCRTFHLSHPGYDLYCIVWLLAFPVTFFFYII